MASLDPILEVGRRENAPAALIRKAICSTNEKGYYEMEIWGFGGQRRSFLYIDDCVDAIVKLMESDYSNPLTIDFDDANLMKELTCIAFEIVGITKERARLITDENKFVGIQVLG
ncbi:glycosyltransferase family 2 protein [Gigaspora margarita]|uniref:Glycosyltransferase family 2 protein n=1 Tax=Gigaspora margarita TaxID=4874 RepID=A0A8H4ABD4_GIGMA|nr:glycosyltransferase family 2 protein [Gigaspora margarita]